MKRFPVLLSAIFMALTGCMSEKDASDVVLLVSQSDGTAAEGETVRFGIETWTIHDRLVSLDISSYDRKTGITELDSRPLDTERYTGEYIYRAPAIESEQEVLELIFSVTDNPMKGKSAKTEYKVLKQYGKHALLLIRIYTGRTHQIRVHLKSIGHPVAGDVLYSSDGETTSQAAMVIMNHQTGEVLACTGGLGEKETFRGLNRATQSQRQTGSSIKPLAVLAPGIDKKTFTASTIYDDEKTTFSDGYAPGNNSGYLGEITVRRALESSQNIPFVEMMEQVTPRRAISYLENMGITSLTPEDESLALALGGLQHGITPLEMAGAYATIANDGVYIEPTFYTSIVNSKGRSVLEAKQEKRTVFSEQVAFVLKQLLKQPVEGRYGTATYCSISGIDVAAKTGTTDDNYDKWLCGFTPYYTAVTWYGFDNNESIYYYNQNPAGIIWANVMRSVHNGLTGARFTEPSWITTAEICADTGMLARTGCTNTYTEYYLWGTEPDLCTKHSGSKVSASQSTQDDEEKVYVDEDNDLELNPNDEEEAPEVEPTNIIEEENTVDDEPIDVPENNTVEEENNVDSGSNNNAESENTVIDDTPPENEDNEEEPEPPRENTTVPEPPQENDTTVADEPADSEE